MRYVSIACALALLAGLLGLVQNSGTPADHGSAIPFDVLGPGAARAADEQSADWGTIKGQVVWGESDLPEAKKIDVDKDKDFCLSQGPIYSQDWVINKDNKGIRYVFVWLAPADPKSKKKLPIHPSLAKPPAEDAVMDQPCCTFIPHALALREGQNLVSKNSAQVAHNVNIAGNPIRNPGSNVLLATGSSHTFDDLKADRLPLHVTCNIHPWMKAWVGVYDHPYFAVTDSDGKFEIKQAPAGDFRLVIWQESVGFRGGAEGRTGMPITIKGGGVTDLGKLELKSKYE